MDRLITAPADEISGKQFFDALFGDKRDQRDQRDRALCMAAIERGDTYGWPPAMVAECRKLMAQEQVLELTVRQLTGERWSVAA